MCPRLYGIPTPWLLNIRLFLGFPSDADICPREESVRSAHQTLRIPVFFPPWNMYAIQIWILQEISGSCNRVLACHNYPSHVWDQWISVRCTHLTGFQGLTVASWSSALVSSATLSLSIFSHLASYKVEIAAVRDFGSLLNTVLIDRLRVPYWDHNCWIYHWLGFRDCRRPAILNACRGRSCRSIPRGHTGRLIPLLYWRFSWIFDCNGAAFQIEPVGLDYREWY